MDSHLIWIVAGLIMIIMEFLIPGGIISFLGISALIVGLGVYFNIIDSVISAFITWFITSLILLLTLRSVFMKYFEGDSVVQDVDEDTDSIGAIVEVVEEVQPYKEGRIRYRETTWIARSDEHFDIGARARILKREGNIYIIKTL